MTDMHIEPHSFAIKRRILVVEDEFVNQEMLRLILADAYDVIIVGTGAEALQEVKKHYDILSLILLDLNLPDMHGLEVLRRLKDDRRYARLPVIVLTADKEAEVESLSIGAIDFIPKPYPQPKVVHARVLRTIELSEGQNIIRETEFDHLTGLYNKEYFYHYAERFDIYHKELATDAIVLDINHFHMINERYGKTYGDQTLKGVGERIRNFIKDSDGIACRCDADRFFIYCPHCNNYEDILSAATVAMDSNNETKVRLRMGVYSNVDKSIDIDRRFDRAKQAADTVKNTIVRAIGVYDDSMHKSEIFAEQLIEDFQTAIRDKQFKVYYQPKFNIQHDTPLLCSAEALARWVHPKLGMISPGVFIPLFEGNGLIQELDNYIWQETAAQIRTWKDRLGRFVPVSMNVSRLDMYDPKLVEKLVGIVRQHGLDFSDLLLEVTESAYMDDSELIIEKVKKLREYGFRIEMDDFGSGYSSLNMITTLPIDALKMDMHFIRTAFSERGNTRMLEIALDISRFLGVPMIAEGVETEQQMLALKEMGCDIVQGYFFAKPMPSEEFESYLS